MSNKLFLIMALAGALAVPGTALARGGFHGGGHGGHGGYHAATTVVTMAAITEATMGVSMECIAAASIVVESIVVADDIGEAAGIPMALGPAGGGIRILAVGSGPATNHEGPMHCRN
jgi:hypothetical protein